MKGRILLAAVFLGSACTRGPDSAVRYGTARVSRGNIVQHVTASGTIAAVVSVDVGSQVSGKIVALHADFNSSVAKGQLIAEVDPSTYVASLRQAEGELASAKATATLKRQNLARKQRLVPLRAASQLDLDQAIAELDQAEASVVIKDAALRSARTNLGYCRVTAPVHGIVISRKVDVGQTVNAAMSTPLLFTVAQDITRMNIRADVSEVDIGVVREGQSVEFTVDAFPDEVFSGTVTQVRKAATTTQNVVTYEAIVGFTNRDQKLFPGMTADISILVAEHDHVLKIPNGALRYSPPESARFEETPPDKLRRGQRLVYAPGAQPGTLRPVIVRTGLTDGTDTEILEGLAEGGSVVVSTLSSGKRREAPASAPGGAT